MRSAWSLLVVGVLALTSGRARALDLPCGAGPDFEILSTSGNFNHAAFGVARNGETIGAAAEIGVAYAWDAAGSGRSLPVPSPPGRSYNGTLDRLVPVAISDDGSSIVGIFQPAFPDPWEVVLWQGGTVLQLGIRPVFRSPPSGGPIYQWGAPSLGITEDGFKIVGTTIFTNPDGSSTWDAYEWFPGAGLARLPSPPGDSGTAAGVSGDGRVVVGGARNGIALHWVDGVLGSLVQGCGDPTVNRSGALATSRDGSVIVGWSTSNDCSTQVPTVWRDGVRLEIPLASVQPTYGGGNGQKANGVSADGRLVVGQDGAGFFGGKAFLWDEANGTRDLKELLSTRYGLGDLVAGWDLLDASDVSIDDEGRIRIVGVARSSSGVGPFEPFRATIPCLDDDLDGLCNEWERQGYIDIDRDGVRSAAKDLILPGADPKRMNIYVEVDAISGTNLSDAAMQAVEKQFLKVPAAKVGNPDGHNGILLRLEKDELNLTPLPGGYSPSVGCGMPLEFETRRSSFFGTPLQRADPAVLAAKAALYRYVIAGSSHSKGASGEATPFGPGVIMTMANFATRDGTEEQQAATLMHELGHTFGLGHGGAAIVLAPGGEETRIPIHTNLKPNYHSVMSYTWQFRSGYPVSSALGTLAYHFSWRLDYSRSLFNVLDESALDEDLGIGARLDSGHNRHFVPTGPLPARAEPEVGRVDFDRDGLREFVPVAANLNSVNPRKPDAGLTLLIPSDDWTHVARTLCENYRHPNWIRPSNLAVCDGWSGSTDPGESRIDMTPQDVDDLTQDYPIDCNGNGVDDQIEVSQGLEVDADGDGLLESCEPLEGDCNGDDAVDDGDRDVLIASFGRLEGEPEFVECADLDGDQQVTFVDHQLWREARARFDAGRAGSGSACGLLGIEPWLLLGGGAAWRRRSRRRIPG